MLRVVEIGPRAINTGKKTQWIQWRFTKKLARGFPSYKFQIDLPLKPLGEFTGLNARAIYHRRHGVSKKSMNRWMQVLGPVDHLSRVFFRIEVLGRGRFHYFEGFLHPNKKVSLREIGSAKIRWSEFVVAKYFPMAAARGTRQDHQWINWENCGNLSDPHL